jgi:hypothetical protein
LSDLPLSFLELEGCSRLPDLAPLAHLPLAVLRLSGTALHDLAPLARLPLSRLLLADCAVADLTPLAACPLSDLILTGTAVTTLAPLIGSALLSLVLGSAHPIDLDRRVLRSVRRLQLAGCSWLRDLSPLAGLELTDLDIRGTSVSDLSPLAGMPLRHLEYADCPITGPLPALRLREVAPGMLVEPELPA